MKQGSAHIIQPIQRISEDDTYCSVLVLSVLLLSVTGLGINKMLAQCRIRGSVAEIIISTSCFTVA